MRLKQLAEGILLITKSALDKDATYEDWNYALLMCKQLNITNMNGYNVFIKDSEDGTYIRLCPSRDNSVVVILLQDAKSLVVYDKLGEVSMAVYLWGEYTRIDNTMFIVSKDSYSFNKEDYERTQSIRNNTIV